jgi:hypothetical protein
MADQVARYEKQSSKPSIIRHRRRRRSYPLPLVMKRCAEVEGSKPDTESEGAHEARDKHMVGKVGHGQRQHH